MKHIIILSILLASPLLAQETKPSAWMLPDETETPRMKTWINYHYGMFIHFSMNTFVGTQQVPNPPGGTNGVPVMYSHRKSEKEELYDLVHDIGETTDVSAQHPEIVKQLEAEVEKARADLGDALTKRTGDGHREPGRLKENK